MPPRSRTKPTAERVKISQREHDALELRKAGATYHAIARQMGYNDKSAARKAVVRAMDATIREPADEVRRMEIDRLDTLLRALWPHAVQGRWLAVDRILRIMERRAQLLGLDAPQRKIVNVITEDVIDAEIRRLEEELAGNDGAQADGNVRA